MGIVVYAEASDGSNPGHMVLGEEPSEGVPSYFGYRFDPADLPEEFRRPEQWRTYLFDQAVRGSIVNESAYIRYLLASGVRTYYEKRAECETSVHTQLPPTEMWAPHAWYSFNPDNPHPGRQPCYNCVKWASVIANAIVEGFLPLVPQGRIKHILNHLQKRDRPEAGA